MPPKPEPRWQIDRHIPIALIVSMFLQTIGIVWWASNLTSRVTQLEHQVSSQGQSLAPLLDRAARFETKIEGLTEHLLEVKGLLRNSIMTYMPPALGPASANPQRPALSR